MRTEIRTKGLEDRDDELKNTAERRVRTALSRFAGSIRLVDVQLADAPKGADKRCRITVRFNRGGELLLTEADHRVEASISRAANRMARTVAKQLDRQLNKRQTGSYRAVG
jgi:ribosome-associated translation inhibitor RaiA